MWRSKESRLSLEGLDLFPNFDVLSKMNLTE